MGPVTHLSREERIGLGLAAVAHVALVAGLYYNVQDDPTPLPIPERMTVSLADQVSLESTAPDAVSEVQAAVAPVLAPEPAPVIEPMPEPVVAPQPKPTARPTPTPRPTASPRPTPRATAKPTPTPTARPSPRPTSSARPTPTPSARPTTAPTLTNRGGGSRLGSDFLAGAGASQSGATRGTQAATFGAAEQASLQQAINRQLGPNWSAPQGLDAEKLVTVLVWELNEDGSLRGRPQLVRQTGITDSNRPQAPLHAERAIKAVQLAAPFDLPKEFYSKWKRLTWTFDRRLGP
ncbi:hypothetical protein [Altererythrobacter sp. Root672]|uniref:hypothetical protein n=1 Tax=Altererythrobacter sp. Root672 TaxID=1736584 RepID=UPI0006FE91A6|nr:hypothetical protein [Altererythrobacter sp. Root672]KRA79352.1 hypothetical protein ASD76_17400 [Altererythrobacter sp. Root672]